MSVHARTFVLLGLVFSQFAQAAEISRIRLDQVLFGVEYTFQDREMVNEPGRNTMSTPHKEEKARQIVYAIANNIGLNSSAVVSKTTWKPGHYINVPGDGKWVVNTEPVTIEVNTTPRHFHEIAATAQPIFAATQAAGLVPYVNPAAERSGMGHIHVGARKMGENPFFKHPLLLRNVMVYLHKSPSLLHGFAEAFDIGLNSNIETYHTEERQKEFQAAVDEFDRWYENAGETQRQTQGFNRFLQTLQKHDKTSKFFHHYRFMNLEHVKNANFVVNQTGKLTIEFRNFRPPKDPQTAEAFAELLANVMEKQSKPGHVEPFRWISKAEYDIFNTGTKVLEDWAKVRGELELKNKHLDAAVAEYAYSIQRQRFVLSSLRMSELFPAYSQKETKGTFFELRLPVIEYPGAPALEIAGRLLTFEQISIGSKSYWITVIDTRELGISPEDLKESRVPMKIDPHGACKAVFGRAG